MRLVEPFFHATPVENVSTWKFLDDLLLFESLYANRTGPGTGLHNHCLDSFLLDLEGKLFGTKPIIKCNDFG